MSFRVADPLADAQMSVNSGLSGVFPLTVRGPESGSNVPAGPCSLLALGQDPSSCGLKRQSQPKSWELCFIWWKIFGLQAWESASQSNLEKLLLGDWWGMGGGGGREGRVGYNGVLQQRAGSLNIKRLLSVKGNHVFQVKEFSPSL